MIISINKYNHGEVVVAQLTKQSLPILEGQGSNPAIGNFYIKHLRTVNLYR